MYLVWISCVFINQCIQKPVSLYYPLPLLAVFLQVSLLFALGLVVLPCKLNHKASLLILNSDWSNIIIYSDVF